MILPVVRRSALRFNSKVCTRNWEVSGGETVVTDSDWYVNNSHYTEYLGSHNP